MRRGRGRKNHSGVSATQHSRHSDVARCKQLLAGLRAGYRVYRLEENFVSGKFAPASLVGFVVAFCMQSH